MGDNMLPNLTSEFLVVLTTSCNGANTVIGEIGVIKGLDDFLLNTKNFRNVFSIGEETLEWRDPEWIEDTVNAHLFTEDGDPIININEQEYWAAVKDPSSISIDYQMEIDESLDGIVMGNRAVLQDLADNYIIESWEVVKQLPNHMVLCVKGAKYDPAVRVSALAGVSKL